MRKRYLPPAALLGVVVAVGAGFTVTRAAGPSITAVDPYSWQANGSSPAAVTVMAGGEVKFSYPLGASHHYPILHSGPVGAPPPSCTNIPTMFESAGPGWSGSCKFSQAGTYTFYCGVHGSIMTATVTVTTAGEPIATTEAAGSVTETSAILNGTVNPESHETSYFFKYGTSIGYGSTTTTQNLAADSSNHEVSLSASPLAPGTTYHFKLVAKNEKGITEGADRMFTTAAPPPPPGPPSATTGEATSVSETEATLKGTANPDGKPTKSFFEWGISTSYGQSTEMVSVGEDHLNHPAAAVLTKLAPGTAYHFRLVAKNGSEEVRGADQTFKTVSPPSPRSEPPPPTTTTTTTPPPPPTVTTLTEPPPGSPIAGSPSLHTTQRGTSVKGSLDVSQAGAGGRLEVDLLAKNASLAAAHRSAPVRVGRLVHASLPGGKVAFSVPLTARGKSSLRRHRRLALTVRIALTPVHGMTTTVTRSVTLRS